MLFSETLASMQARDQGWSAVIGEDWSQGRGAFGGIVAALGNEAMRRLVPADRQLRGLRLYLSVPPSPARFACRQRFYASARRSRSRARACGAESRLPRRSREYMVRPRAVQICGCARERTRECARPRICRDSIFPPGKAPAFAAAFRPALRRGQPALPRA